MVIIACFKLDPEVAAVHIRVLAGTFMVDGHHVAAHVGDDSRYALQLSGFIDQLNI